MSLSSIKTLIRINTRPLVKLLRKKSVIWALSVACAAILVFSLGKHGVAIWQELQARKAELEDTQEIEVDVGVAALTDEIDVDTEVTDVAPKEIDAREKKKVVQEKDVADRDREAVVRDRAVEKKPEMKTREVIADIPEKEEQRAKLPPALSTTESVRPRPAAAPAADRPASARARAVPFASFVFHGGNMILSTNISRNHDILYIEYGDTLYRSVLMSPPSQDTYHIPFPAQVEDGATAEQVKLPQKPYATIHYIDKTGSGGFNEILRIKAVYRSGARSSARK